MKTKKKPQRQTDRQIQKSQLKHNQICFSKRQTRHFYKCQKSAQFAPEQDTRSQYANRKMNH